MPVFFTFYGAVHIFFTARRYASAVLAVVVCLSVTSRYCIETTGRIELVLARGLSSTYPTPCYKEIRVSRTVPNSRLKFRHGKSIVLSTKLVDGRAC